MLALMLLLALALVPALFPDESIQSYEQCKAQHHPTVNLFPRTCKVPDGREFVQVGNDCWLGDFECAQGSACRSGKCVVP